MTTYENVEIMDKNELKAITFESTKYDAPTVSKIVKYDKIGKALTAYVERHKDIIKAHEDELKSNKLITVEHADVPYFSKDDFISVYGEDEYKRFCVIRDRKTVKFG